MMGLVDEASDVFFPFETGGATLIMPPEDILKDNGSESMERHSIKEDKI